MWIGEIDVMEDVAAILSDIEYNKRSLLIL